MGVVKDRPVVKRHLPRIASSRRLNAMGEYTKKIDKTFPPMRAGE